MTSLKISLDLQNISAVIFDMDRTMIANMKHHDLAWDKFLERYKIHLTEDE